MSRQGRSSRGVLITVPIVMIALVATSCARSVTLGYEEAIEVMVLDGTDRARAACIVSALDGRIALDKVTGLNVDLSDDELDLLATMSSRCAPALAVTGGVVGGAPISESVVAAEMAAAEAEDVDVETEVYRMVAEGLDPTLAECLIVGLSIYPDPAEVFADELRLSGEIVDCLVPDD